ncbi:histidine phosphatase family protein [Kitasatospora xanthocidica]|uniref:histidine phosphatase family protein n=1 Tax=Kitasatospora xanthocidica TaxID=83382 RepID=UPI001C70773D|nr:histidine phosphatase family protein [Kitasatospora xanthocidica]
MPLICLVRHGQASAAAQDYDALSGLGRAQAAVVGRELARRGLRDPHIVSGTLTRQRDTARLLAQAAGFTRPVREDARWNEYDHQALLARYAKPPQGVRSAQELIDRALTAWMADTAATDGESWADFARTPAAALAALTDSLDRGRDAVVVTSAGPLPRSAARCCHCLRSRSSRSTAWPSTPPSAPWSWAHRGPAS